MFNLIKLELTKFKIKGNIVASFICTLCILGFTWLLFFLVGAEGTATANDYKVILQIVNQFINGVFVLFAGVLISKFIIEEYKNKTIFLLFTYPVNRIQILLAKVIIIIVFTFLSIVLSSFLIYSFYYLLQVTSGVVIWELTLPFVVKQLANIILLALTNSIISLVPIYFGLRKNSVATTIITSILIVTFLYSGSPEFNLYSTIVVPIFMMIAGIFAVYFTVHNSEKEDVKMG
ncbi:ABC transporter permease [Bacillus aquiflavi]|uniref:ABC transporter permease n=1 Tax=Bacillus aquiflavi TaxID=2672567 RepID=A0A6B3VXA1_9BACI|nr:ABC transporter permease [Bacillus aquiflavi]MBA4538557.1 ABC transporter permease [Bacillus aquiflavi]NEY82920.1 ABC transporter permease subunit [Bacillus aquiflavi]UAC48023.1 ABC transporter permease [Bacillus aquiflavi]